MHGKVLAVPRIHRGRIDAEQPEPATEQSAHAGFRQGRPILWKCTGGDAATGAQQQALDEWQRLNLFQILYGDLLFKDRNVDDDCRAEERFEGELVRAGPSLADVQWRISVGSDVRARGKRGHVDARARAHQRRPAAGEGGIARPFGGVRVEGDADVAE